MTVGASGLSTLHVPRDRFPVTQAIGRGASNTSASLTPSKGWNNPQTEHDITTPIHRTALSRGVAAITGTTLALLGGQAAAAAGPGGVGPEADPVLALWWQYLDMAAAEDRAWRPPNVW